MGFILDLINFVIMMGCLGFLLVMALKMGWWLHDFLDSVFESGTNLLSKGLTKLFNKANTKS